MASNYYREVRVNPRYLRNYNYGGYGGGGGGDIGSTISKALEGIQQRIQQGRQQAAQDQIVNQMMNTRMAPRAALVTSPSGQGLRIDPRTGQQTAFNIPRGLSTAGTAPFTGGAQELQNRIAAQKLINEYDPVGAAVQRARAQVAASAVTGNPPTGAGSRGGTTRTRVGGGGGGGGARTTTATTATAKPGKQPAEPAYVPNSEQNPANYNRDKLAADFDHVYGKGAFDKIYPQLGNIRPPSFDANGNPVSSAKDDKGNPAPFTGLMRDNNGNLGYYENGTPVYNIGAGDVADKWQGRFNAMRYNAGLAPLNLVPLPGGAQVAQVMGPNGQMIPNPNANMPVGSTGNPAMPKSTWDIASVPYNSWYVNPNDGKLYQRRSPEQAAQETQQQQREAQQASLHADEREGGPTREMPQGLYDLYETPEDQARIDAIQALQAQQGPQPSDFTSGNLPGRPTDQGPQPSDYYPGSPEVTKASATTGPSPSDFYQGSPGLPASAQPSQPDLSPSDMYTGSPALSYLSPVQAQPPPAQPPDISPQVTGQAANAASTAPPPPPEYVGIESAPAPVPVASYLGGY